MYNSYRLQGLIDQLRASTNTYAQAANNLREISNQLSGTAQNLSTGGIQWEGQGAQSFQMAWRQHQSDIERAANDFECIIPVLRTLAGALEDALTLKSEIERLDPLTALARLGLPLPFGLSHDLSAVQIMVDDALQVALDELIRPVDVVAANALADITMMDLAQQAVSPQGAWLQQDVGVLGSIMGDVTSLVSVFKDIPGPVGYAIDIFGVIAEFYSGDTHDLRTLESDSVGDTIGIAISLTGGGAIVEAVAAGVHLTSIVGAWEQNMFASQFSGSLGSLLQGPASNLQIVAGNADMGAVFDDMGKIFVDSDGTVLNPISLAGMIAVSEVARTFGVNVPGEVDPTTLISDYRDLAIDTGKLVLSPVQLVVNADAAVKDDALSMLDKGIQNLPVSSSIKTSFNAYTIEQIQNNNEIADFFTKPQGIEKVGEDVWRWANL